MPWGHATTIHILSVSIIFFRISESSVDEPYFDWEIAESGYDWVETTPILTRDGSPGPTLATPYLRANWDAARKSLTLRRYRPLKKHSGLFRSFCEVTPDRRDIVRFANRYGPLLGPRGDLITLPHSTDAGSPQHGIGESLSSWTTAIATMQQTVLLWTAAREGDVATLSRHITWRKGNDETGQDVFYNSHPEFEPVSGTTFPDGFTMTVIVSSTRDEAFFRHLMPGDVIRPAMILVQRRINEQLSTRVAPRILWDEDQTALKVYQVPESLLGALWLQFALAVERNNDFRTCAECGTWFELSPGTARSDKIYCSTACRLKAFRRRKADAISRQDQVCALPAVAARIDFAAPKHRQGRTRKTRNPRRGKT